MPPSVWHEALQSGSTVSANLPKQSIKTKPAKIPKVPPAQPCKLEGIFHSWLCEIANKNAKNRNHAKHHCFPTPRAPTAWSWCPITTESNDSSLKQLFAFYPAAQSCHISMGRKFSFFSTNGNFKHAPSFLEGAPSQARLRGKASSTGQARQGHSSKRGAPNKIRILSRFHCETWPCKAL